MSALSDDTLVTVCDACLCASCWQHKFVCDSAFRAGTKKMRVGELRKLNREHPDYWKTDAELWR